MEIRFCVESQQSEGQSDASKQQGQQGEECIQEVRGETPGELFTACLRAGRKRSGHWRIKLDSATDTRTAMKLVEQTARCIYDGAYQFRKECLRELKGEILFEVRDTLADFGDGVYTFVSSHLSEDSARAAIERGTQLGICKGYARSLGNLPNNFLHSWEMAEYAKQLALNLGDSVTCQILDYKALEESGCGGLLAVNWGKRKEAYLVMLEYKGDPSTDRKLALLGKGLMFDSGGYHLKSMEAMHGMKYDMCGAAGVLEAFEVLVRRRTPVNLLSVLALGENLMGPDAVKMGDVITTLSGKTVEIYNTDAEGRLALCDGLTWAQRAGASEVLDLATLTYSAQAALGDEVSAFFGNHEECCREWLEAARITGEPFWRMPLGERYHRYLEWSICADFANYAPGKGAGASVAACFLENFVEEGTKWLHLDMVGPSVVRSAAKEMSEGASGVCIATIVEYVERR